MTPEAYMCICVYVYRPNGRGTGEEGAFIDVVPVSFILPGL